MSIYKIINVRIVFMITILLTVLSFTLAQSNDFSSELLASTQPSDTSKTAKRAASINELKQLLNIQRIQDPYSHHVEKQINLIIAALPNNPYERNIPLKVSLAKSSFEVGKFNFKSAIQMQPKFLSAGDLGILGDIFLYANAAAAGYALYMHFKKYGDEY